METNPKIEKETNNHSGGVKTPEGKAISRYNAQKHAILRETLTEYESVEAEGLYNDLFEDLMPKNRMQEIVVEIVGSNTIKLQRIAKAESEVVKESLGKSKSELKFFSSDYIPNLSSKAVEKLDLYSRYQTATENRIYRALFMLKQLQSNEKE